MTQTQIRILQTTEHRCGYFADRQSRNLLIDPNAEDLASLYAMTIHAGFRRSGDLVYRPHCRDCSACQSTRVPVEQFQPSRSQRRCLRRNRDLQSSFVEACLTDDYFSLYERYLQARHPEGGMDNPETEDFSQFLLSDWSPTFFLEARLDQQLVAVAVCDQLPSGLSAVYSFFAPELSQRSLGTWLILQQIEWAKQLKLPYVYLGYWIENHPKMQYKVNFKPIEILRDGLWEQR